MNLTARTNAHLARDSLPLMARSRHANAKILLAYSAPSSQPSPRASLLVSRNGSSTSLARISGAFHSRSRSRNTSSSSGAPSGGSSRHNSHVSVSSASLVLGRARAHNLIQGIGGASRSGIELILGHMPSSPPATGAVRLGDTSDVDGSEGALSNPESHTFGLHVVGGTGSLLPRRTGMRAHMLEGDPGRSSVSVSSSSSSAAATTTAVATAMMARARSARGRRRHQSQGAVVCVLVARILYHLRGSVRGLDYNRLTRLDLKVHGYSNSTRKRHRPPHRFCRSRCSLKTPRAGRRQHRQ